MLYNFTPNLTSKCLQTKRCGFIKWADEVRCPTCEVVIPVFVRCLNMRDEEVKRKENQLMKWQFATIFLLMLLVYLVFV